MSKELIHLPGLADKINEAHAKFVSAASSALEHAIAAGEALLAAKDSMPHGAFGPWLQTNTRCSIRIAQRYMRLARNRNALVGDDAPATISGALKRLATPRPQRPTLQYNQGTPQEMLANWRHLMSYGMYDCRSEPAERYPEFAPEDTTARVAYLRQGDADWFLHVAEAEYEGEFFVTLAIRDAAGQWSYQGTAKPIGFDDFWWNIPFVFLGDDVVFEDVDQDDDPWTYNQVIFGADYNAEGLLDAADWLSIWDEWTPGIANVPVEVQLKEGFSRQEWDERHVEIRARYQAELEAYQQAVAAA